MRIYAREDRLARMVWRAHGKKKEERGRARAGKRDREIMRARLEQCAPVYELRSDYLILCACRIFVSICCGIFVLGKNGIRRDFGILRRGKCRCAKRGL